MIKWIIISVIALVVLGALGFDVRKAIESPVARSNIEYAKDAVVYIWTTYLKKPVLFLWNEIFIKLIWNTALSSLMQKDSPDINYNFLELSRG